jgi:hypothetical protein
MDIHDIAEAPTEVARDAASSWSRGDEQLRQVSDNLRTIGDFESWRGQSANAMRHRVDSSANRVFAAALAAQGTSLALHTQATFVASVQALVRPTMAAVTAAKMTVAPDGTVHPGLLGLLPGSPVAALAVGATAAFKAAMSFLTTTDTAAAGAINGLCAVDTPPSPTPVTISPDAAAELVADPTAMAEDVTIPAPLQRTMSTAEQDKIRQAVVEARTQLALRGIEPGQVEVTVQELNGQAVVVAGDLAAADTVTTLVSGVGSSEAGRVVGTSSTAGRIAGPGNAVIAWHGYQAPTNALSGADPTHARYGAPALQGLQSTLREKTGGAADLQIVAHSYGSTLLGHAAAEESAPLEADVVHLVGSPGTGHARADDLQLRTRNGSGDAEIHAWRSPGDMIRLAEGVNLIHGRSPTSPLFGADTIDGAPASEQGGVIGALVDDLTDVGIWSRDEWGAHSGYWSDEQFLENVR